jgi:RNA polymerase sigma-70 factor (ECF subfamily)
MVAVSNSSSDSQRPPAAPLRLSADGPPEDLALLRQAQRGDSSAFGELIERHADRLYGLARSLVGNEADAEDVLQETLAGAFKAAATFREEASVKTWLTRILVRQAAMHRRSAKKWRFMSLFRGDEQGSEMEVATPDAKADAGGEADSRLDVPVMLAELSAEHREVIVLRELEGLSYEQMAETLRVPRGTVESRLHRARQELKQKFGKYFERD